MLAVIGVWYLYGFPPTPEFVLCNRTIICRGLILARYGNRYLIGQMLMVLVVDVNGRFGERELKIVSALAAISRALIAEHL